MYHGNKQYILNKKILLNSCRVFLEYTKIEKASESSDFVTNSYSESWNTSWGGTLGISGWGCAAGTLEPFTYTRASSAEFCYPILE